MNCLKDNMIRDEDLAGVNGGTGYDGAAIGPNMERNVLCPECGLKIMVNLNVSPIICPECKKDITAKLAGLGGNESKTEIM